MRSDSISFSSLYLGIASGLGEEMDTETEISGARFPYNPIHLLCIQFFV